MVRAAFEEEFIIFVQVMFPAGVAAGALFIFARLESIGMVAAIIMVITNINIISSDREKPVLAEKLKS